MIITGTLIKNEIEHISKFLERARIVLSNLPKDSKHIFLDNGSNDGTAEVLREFQQEFSEQVIIIESDLDFLKNETELRSLLWEEIRKIGTPKKDWVLILDCDEIISDNLIDLLNVLEMPDQNEMAEETEVIALRLKEIWDEDNNLYRIDGRWSPYFHRLFRFFDEQFTFVKKSGLHHPPIPDYATTSTRVQCLDIDIYHYSYSTLAKRERKEKYYLENNKDAGGRAHAKTINQSPKLKSIAKKYHDRKFAICSLIHNRTWALPYFLKSIKNSNLPFFTKVYFVANNCNKETLEILNDFEINNANLDVEIEIYDFELIREHGNHDWDGELLYQMNVMRNKCLEFGRKHNLEAIVSIDSDVVFPSEVIKHLIESDKDIISPVFWAIWDGKSIYDKKWPQVWDRGGYELSDETFHRLKYEKRMRVVGGLGAFTKISSAVWERDVNYDNIYNLPSDMRGEDRNFCIRAVVNGFLLWASTYFDLLHLDNEEMLAHYEKEGLIEKALSK